MAGTAARSSASETRPIIRIIWRMLVQLQLPTSELPALVAQIRALYEGRVIHPEQSARMRQSMRCRQIVKADGIQERL